MAIQVVTTEDLQVFKLELFDQVKELLASAIEPKKEFLKNKDVKKLLGISTATLQTLRINGTLTFSKIGGTIYYRQSDVEKIFNKNLKEVKRG